MTNNGFSTLYVYDTINNADTVEWCPVEPYRDTFACGTYHLVEGDKDACGNEEPKGYFRTGGILLFTVTKEKLEENDQVVCPAVLDMKWRRQRLNGKIVLGVANAVGEVCVFELREKKLLFLTKCVLKKSDGDFLTLSLDWSKRDSEDLLCISDSKGNVTIAVFSVNGINVLKEWQAHSLEAWIVCFDSFQGNVAYSGGDEGVLKVWDHRTESAALLASSKKHEAGVTVVNSNLHKEYCLISGSYDEFVLFWDTRNWKNPVKNIAASGGLWRLKWEPHPRSQYVLGACIYGGFQVYDTFSNSPVAEYKEHESLAYGADWCHLQNKEVDELLERGPAVLIATCSFYDHHLRVSLWSRDRET